MRKHGSERVRVVVFDNPDHAPSRRMHAAVCEVAAQRSGIDVERVDVWQDPRSAVEHQVLTTPTTVIFAGPEEQQRLVGLQSTCRIARTIDHVVVNRPVPASSAH